MRDHQTIKDSFKVGVTLGKLKILIEGVGARGMYAALFALVLLLIAGVAWGRLGFKTIFVTVR